MAIGRHLVIETMEAAARMGKSALTERIIYPDSFPTLNPQLAAMSTSFAKKISKKRIFSPGRNFRHRERRRRFEFPASDATSMAGLSPLAGTTAPPGRFGAARGRTEVDRDHQHLRRMPKNWGPNDAAAR